MSAGLNQLSELPTYFFFSPFLSLPGAAEGRSEGGPEIDLPPPDSALGGHAHVRDVFRHSRRVSLSRLNRGNHGKESTRILDFVDDLIEATFIPANRLAYWYLQAVYAAPTC